MDLARWRWDESLAIGIDEIDRDHKHFSSLIQDLDDALVTCADESIIESHIKSIADDALRHFENEDGLLAKYDYPERKHHAKAHNEIRAILTAMTLRDSGSLPARDTKGGAVLSLDQLKVLLVSHLIYEDALFRDFLRTRFSGERK